MHTQAHQDSSGAGGGRQSAPLLDATEEGRTAGKPQQQLMHPQQHRQRLQQQNELCPQPQLIKVDTGPLPGPKQKQHHHQRGRQNEHERPRSAEWDESFRQDESDLDFQQPTSLQILPHAYSEQQQKQSQRGYGGNMGQPHPNTDPCLLDRNSNQPPKHKRGAGSRPQKSMEEQLPDPIYPPAAVEYDRDRDRQRKYYNQEGDNLMLDLSSDIQELIRGEVGSYRDREFQVTLEHVPRDPNLTCPYCQKVFRKGEIQKFKRHVQLVLCKGSADDGTVM